MAAAMGLWDSLRRALRPQERMLDELAAIAGRNEDLAGRLRRHAERCSYPNIRAGVEELAEKEMGHARALAVIVQEHGRWPRPPEPRREGMNNWERLGGDLEILAELDTALHRAAAEWEAYEPELSERLLAIALEDDENEGALRKLVLKCDPQALD
jgi:rubrerythrin